MSDNPESTPLGFAIAGAAGRDKRAALRLLLGQLAARYPRGCYLISPQDTPLAAGATGWGVLEPLLGGVAGAGDEIEALLGWAVGELEERRLREARGDMAWQASSIYIAVDELPGVLARHPRALDQLGQLLWQGPAYEIAVIAATADSLLLGIPPACS